MRSTYGLEGLNCASCAAKIEEKAKDIPGVMDAQIDLVGSKIYLEEEVPVDQLDTLQKIVSSIEDGVTVSREESIELEEKAELSKKFIALLVLIIAGTVLVSLYVTESVTQRILFGVLLLVAGFPVYKQSIVNISHGEVFDENFLMSIATIAAFFVGEYSEAIGVMVFYRLGEELQDLAMNRSRNSISALLKTEVTMAHRLQGDDVEDILSDKLEVGDHILIYPGETIPVDGVVINGESFLNTASMTGESKPVRVSADDEVYSGYINEDGTLTMKVEAVAADSAMARIQKMVEESSLSKAPVERWMTKFAKVYTPVVVFIALFVGLLVPLIFNQDFNTWIYRACIFLIISCPCALVLSIPLSIFAGIGRGSKDGVYIRGGDRLEAINDLDAMVFDKTGTLTDGKFDLDSIDTLDCTEEELLSYAKAAEQFSNHPIARALMEVDRGNILSVKEHREVSGQGIVAELADGGELAVGNQKLLTNLDIQPELDDFNHTTVHVALDGSYLGRLGFKDHLKTGVEESINNIQKKGLKTYLLSGDQSAIVDELATQLNFTEGKGNLYPEEKLNFVESLMDRDAKVGFVGDGLNDAPVLAKATVGIAMGDMGSDLAIASSDVVILNDDISRVNWLIDLASHTRKVTNRNITFALGTKIIVMILGVFGIANMWMAIFADVGVTLISVLYAMTLLNWDK